MGFFLKKQKNLDLSDKQRDGEDSKKVKERNSGSSLPDKAFSGDLNSPELVKLLVNYSKSIDNQVKKLFTSHQEAKESQIKVTQSLEFTSTKYDDLEKNI